MSYQVQRGCVKKQQYNSFMRMMRVAGSLSTLTWMLLPSGWSEAFSSRHLSLPSSSRTSIPTGSIIPHPTRPSCSSHRLSFIARAAVPPHMSPLSENSIRNTTSISWDHNEPYVNDDNDDEYNNEMFTPSWSNEDEEEEEHDDEGDGMEDQEDDSFNENIEELYSPLMEEYDAWYQALEQALQKLEKKHKSLESELVKAQNVEATVFRAQLLVSNLYLFPRGTKSAWVPDWDNGGVEMEVRLDPQYDSAAAEADALFAQARKLKRGSQVVQQLLEETTGALQTLQDAKVDLGSAKLSSTDIDEGRLAFVKERLVRSARATNIQIPDLSRDGSSGQDGKAKKYRYGSSKPELGSPASNIRKLISPGGCTVLVGRNRRGNEYLSLTLARQDDVWMHSRGSPGAHVVIQNRRGGPTPTEACFQFAADLAVFYSDLRTEAKAEVTAAEPKHLLKPRGAPLGAIKIREEWRTFVGRPDQVPEELKVARDQSGQSDEYRQEDKAKNRRRTKQAAEEGKARKRRKNKSQ